MDTENMIDDIKIAIDNLADTFDAQHQQKIDALEKAIDEKDKRISMMHDHIALLKTQLTQAQAMLEKQQKPMKVA